MSAYDNLFILFHAHKGDKYWSSLMCFKLQMRPEKGPKHTRIGSLILIAPLVAVTGIVSEYNSELTCC